MNAVNIRHKRVYLFVIDSYTFSASRQLHFTAELDSRKGKHSLCRAVARFFVMLGGGALSQVSKAKAL